jgi:hypothetical protein
MRTHKLFDAEVADKRVGGGKMIGEGVQAIIYISSQGKIINRLNGIMNSSEFFN